MAESEPVAELEPQFSSDDATATPWAEAREILATAKVYWLSTVRPDGRPHVTTIAAIWMDDALYFSTGQTERKAKNLALNPRCVVTTGCNALEGLDVIVEGDVVRVTDESRLWKGARPRSWFTSWLPRRPSGSARASRSARPAGASSERRSHGRSYFERRHHHRVRPVGAAGRPGLRPIH